MGTSIDATIPGDSDVVADHPPGARTFRTNVKTLIATEHYEGVSGNDRHKIGVYADDTARDAAIGSPLEGNFAFQKGSAAAADAPRMLALSFHDGTSWYKGYFVPTGTILMAAYDVASPPEGFLACDGAAVARATYADLFAVIGTAFDQQDGRAAPAGTDFRVPLIAGHTVMGLSAGAKGQLGWVRNVSGLKDVFVTGTYAGAARAIFIVEITGAGTPDTFQWSSDGGATFTTGVSVAATNVLGATGLTLNWQATTGHAVGDVWIFVADPLMDTVGASLGVDAWRLNTDEAPLRAHRHLTVYDQSSTGSHALTAGNSMRREYNAGDNAYTLQGPTSGTPDPDISRTSEAEDTTSEAHESAPHAVVLGHLVKT